MNSERRRIFFTSASSLDTQQRFWPTNVRNKETTTVGLEVRGFRIRVVPYEIGPSTRLEQVSCYSADRLATLAESFAKSCHLPALTKLARTTSTRIHHKGQRKASRPQHFSLDRPHSKPPCFRVCRALAHETAF